MSGREVGKSRAAKPELRARVTGVAGSFHGRSWRVRSDSPRLELVRLEEGLKNSGKAMTVCVVQSRVGQLGQFLQRFVAWRLEKRIIKNYRFFLVGSYGKAHYNHRTPIYKPAESTLQILSFFFESDSLLFRISSKTWSHPEESLTTARVTFASVVVIRADHASPRTAASLRRFECCTAPSSQTGQATAQHVRVRAVLRLRRR